MPRTPQDFPGPLYEEQIEFYDQYGLPPSVKGAMLYSDGYFYAKDEYGIFNLRQSSNLVPHIYTHLGGGNDSFYVVSPNIPGVNEDINDGYVVGFRWIDTTDGYEFVLIDNTAGAAVWSLTTGGGFGGIAEQEHETLDTLVHNIAEDSFEVITYTNNVVTNVTVWTNSLMIKKIREEQHVYSNCARPSQTTTIQYDGLGNVKWTMVEEYVYNSCGKVINIERTKT